MENSNTSSGDGNSSYGSIMLLENSDSIALQEDWSGVARGDMELELTDPFEGIFYHIMPSEDSTTILFYNKPLFCNLMTVLSKQFKFPSTETQTFTIKMHVNKKACFLYIDKRILSIRASRPGHLQWKDSNFKKLAENMYKSFVRDTNSVLNSSNRTDTQDNQSLSASPVSTQVDEGGNNYTERTADMEPSPVPVLEKSGQKDNTSLQNAPVIHHITALMDMIHKLQNQITNFTQKVNHLIEKVANESLYTTVDVLTCQTLSR